MSLARFDYSAVAAQSRLKEADNAFNVRIALKERCEKAQSRAS